MSRPSQLTFSNCCSSEPCGLSTTSSIWTIFYRFGQKTRWNLNVRKAFRNFFSYLDGILTLPSSRRADIASRKVFSLPASLLFSLDVLWKEFILLFALKTKMTLSISNYLLIKYNWSIIMLIEKKSFIQVMPQILNYIPTVNYNTWYLHFLLRLYH